MIEDLKPTSEYRVRYDDTEENLDTLRKEYQNRKRTRLYNNALRKYLTTHTNIGKLDLGNTFVKNEVSFRSPEHMTDEEYKDALRKSPTVFYPNKIHSPPYIFFSSSSSRQEKI